MTFIVWYVLHQNIRYFLNRPCTLHQHLQACDNQAKIKDVKSTIFPNFDYGKIL